MQQFIPTVRSMAKGPQELSRLSTVPAPPHMSNESRHDRDGYRRRF